MNQASKKIFSYVIALLLVCGIGFGVFYFINKNDNRLTQLNTPVVTINKDDKVMVWNSIKYSESYDIYVNKELEDTVIAEIGKPTYSYNIANFLSSEIVYNFSVVAKAKDYETSLVSGSASFINFNSTVENVNSYRVENKNTKIKNVSVNNNIITWDAVDGESQYYITYFSNNMKTSVLSVNINAYDFTSLANNNDIICFRVGVLNNGKINLAQPVYYNPIQEGEYSKNIFYFNNKLNDYFISNQDEMNALMYYGFVYKKENMNVKISVEYYNSLVKLNNGNTSFKHIVYAMNIACSSFLETSNFETSLKFANSFGYSTKEFGIYIKYVDGKYPSKTGVANYKQNPLQIPNYLKDSFVPRGESYTTFVSDERTMTTKVQTSEELYWAVENQTTPVFTNSNSTAAKLYNKSKSILNSILSDNMTDYEKALNIFDYITFNTTYDYEVMNKTTGATAYKCFYLEGVLQDGLAVCDGFSKAFSLLCNMEGIDTVRISGSVPTGMHAWNKIKIDNKWYVVDITWTEITNHNPSLIGSRSGTEYLSHTYFLVKDDYISSTHKAGDQARDKSMPANEVYSYFNSQKYEFNDEIKDFIITDVNEFKHLINYIYTNNVLSVEVVLGDYFNNVKLSILIKEVKEELKITNIVDLMGGEMCEYEPDKYGEIYILQIQF